MVDPQEEEREGVLRMRVVVVVARWERRERRAVVRKMGVKEAWEVGREVCVVPMEVGMSCAELVSECRRWLTYEITSVFMMIQGTSVNTGGIAPSHESVVRSSKYGKAAVHPRARATGETRRDECGVHSWRLEDFKVLFVTGVKRSAIVNSA